MVLFNDRNHFRPLGIKGAHWTCSGWSSRRAPWTAAPPLYWWRADQILSRVSPCSALFQHASSLISCSLTRRRQNSQVRVIAPSASASDVATTGRAGFSVADETRLSLWHPPGMRLFLEDVHRQHVALLRFATDLRHSRASPAAYPSTSWLRLAVLLTAVFMAENCTAYSIKCFIWFISLLIYCSS